MSERNNVRKKVFNCISNRGFSNFWTEMQKMKGTIMKVTNVMDTVLGSGYNYM